MALNVDRNQEELRRDRLAEEAERKIMSELAAKMEKEKPSIKAIEEVLLMKKLKFKSDDYGFIIDPFTNRIEFKISNTSIMDPGFHFDFPETKGKKQQIKEQFYEYLAKFHPDYAPVRDFLGWIYS